MTKIKWINLILLLFPRECWSYHFQLSPKSKHTIITPNIKNENKITLKSYLPPENHVSNKILPKANQNNKKLKYKFKIYIITSYPPNPEVDHIL